MDNASYVALTRQSGLVGEMRTVANNIANTATSGYRQEGLIFSEFVKRVDSGDSLSMARGNVRRTSFEQGALTQTGGTFDFAIEGDGFFLVQTPAGERLTRAGSFSPGPDGDLVNLQGYPVLDPGGAPVFVPAEARTISVGADGTLSADGDPVGQIAVVQPSDPIDMIREDGVLFRTAGEIEPSDGARLLQGFLENSNVDAISQITRMIEVQRAYEMGQSFLEAEDERVRKSIESLTRTS